MAVNLGAGALAVPLRIGEWPVYLLLAYACRQFLTIRIRDHGEQPVESHGVKATGPNSL